MQIIISGHQLEVTESLKAYVHEKFSKLTNHSDKIISCKVTLTVEKLEQKAEATLHIKDIDINATSVSQDMYAAIDELTNKIDKQLIKHKEKISKKH